MIQHLQLLQKVLLLRVKKLFVRKYNKIGNENRNLKKNLQKHCARFLQYYIYIMVVSIDSSSQF